MTAAMQANILIVEDNDLDAQILKMALKEAGFAKDPTVVDDGAPAIALLEQARHQRELLPQLVILDLNLKRVDGPQVLAHIRQTDALSDLYVVILSSSPTDVMQSRASEANYYLTKPSDLETFLGLGSKILSSYSNAQRA